MRAQSISSWATGSWRCSGRPLPRRIMPNAPYWQPWRYNTPCASTMLNSAKRTGWNACSAWASTPAWGWAVLGITCAWTIRPWETRRIWPARLQEVAEPDTILISDTTRRQVHGAVRLEVLPPVQVKGKTQPVPVYKAVNMRLRRALLAERSERTWGLFAGREHELTVLEELLP